MSRFAKIFEDPDYEDWADEVDTKEEGFDQYVSDYSKWKQEQNNDPWLVVEV